MELSNDYKEFFELLNANGVRYLVIGGFAVALHGHPRYTKDLDIWIWINEQNAIHLLKTLRDFGFGSLGIKSSDLMNPENIFQLGYAPNRIDLITSIEGLDFETCFQEKVILDYHGISINFIDYQHLIQSKKAAGRPQDLADVDFLEKVQKKRNTKKKK